MTEGVVRAVRVLASNVAALLALERCKPTASSSTLSLASAHARDPNSNGTLLKARVTGQPRHRNDQRRHLDDAADDEAVRADIPWCNGRAAFEQRALTYAYRCECGAIAIGTPPNDFDRLVDDAIAVQGE